EGGGSAVDGGGLLVRGIRREGTARAQQAAARMGAAGGRRDARDRARRALVHLGAVVLQRLPAPSPVARSGVAAYMTGTAVVMVAAAGVRSFGCQLVVGPALVVLLANNTSILLRWLSDGCYTS